MAALNMNPARNDLARVFLFPNGIFKCDTRGQFASCVSVDALTQDRGEITTIECPSPYQYGEFVQIGSFPGQLSRMTTTLSGRMSRIDLSQFYKLFRDNCAFDMHLHFGLCQQPNAFNQFDKALVFEDVQVTSFTSDPLIALQSGDRAVINESIAISIGNFYEVVNLSYSERAPALTQAGTSIVKVIICDRRSCGNCEEGSTGCQKIFAIDDTDRFYFTNDGGITWDVLTVETDDMVPVSPTGLIDMACWGDDVLLLDDVGEFWFADRGGLFDGSVTTFQQGDPILTFAPTSFATSLNSTGVIVGAGGNIALFTDFDGGTVLVDAGFATSEALNAVAIGMDGTAVAVGANNAVVFSDNGETWFPTNSDPGTPATALVSVAVKGSRNWLVGAANGELWCTDNAGASWARVEYPGWASNTNPISEIDVATSHVIYFVSGNRLYRSLDGGNSWISEPNSRQNLPANDGLLTVAACTENPNFVIAGGAVGVGPFTGVIITGVETGDSSL